MILLVFLAYYGINCFINVYFIFGPLYEKFGASPGEVGLFLSIFYMAMIACRPLGSLTMERAGIRKTLMGSSLISAAAAAGMAISLAWSLSSPLLFFRAVSGVSASIFIVATVAYQSMILDEKNRGWGFALFTTGSMFPLATVIPLSEWILKQGYNYVYMWLPVLVAAICFGISCIMKETAQVEKKEKAWGTYSELFKIKGVPTLYLSGILMSVADSMTLCVAMLAVDRGVSVSYFMISVSVAAVCIRTLGFKVMNSIPRLLLAAPSAALMGLSVLFLSFSSTPFFFVIFGLLFGLGIGMGYPTHLSLIGDIVPIKLHPKATGGFLLFYDFGWVATPLLFGAIAPLFGASGAFRTIGIVAFACSAAIQYFLWMPMWRERKS